MKPQSTFDKHPAITISEAESDIAVGFSDILEILREHEGRRHIALECYPGVELDPLLRQLVAELGAELVIETDAAVLPPLALEAKFAALLSDDPVFGRMAHVSLKEFFDAGSVDRNRQAIANTRGRVIAIGTGATLQMPDPDLLIYADVCRWEIQQRQRRGEASNLGMNNAGSPPAQLYKRAFFLDWRAADEHRHRIAKRVDFWIDANSPQQPAMISGATMRSALDIASHRPFSLVPFFDAGPWGGQWMRERFALPDGPANYAWGFNCVPEENSLAFRFGSRNFEIPAQMLVHERPEELLGSQIFRDFGAEFPIRFDFLDTMEGGNLSLQVHPLRSYIKDQFGMDYTQDESYYMLDTAPDATVYLGLREGINKRAMVAGLRAAEASGKAFPAEQFVNVWPARKHDHFLIPAGTIHCSGRNSVVLEISATPYIFTFKLWDWGRLGLDGRPRPIHLEHGLKNIQWDRTTTWVSRNLVNQVAPIASGEGWVEERTGLHALEFIETRRHWFTAQVHHHTHGNLNVLNLVEGDAAIVESPAELFPPMIVHYAETFVVPASVGPYWIRPATPGGKPMATIKAYVREVE